MNSIINDFILSWIWWLSHQISCIAKSCGALDQILVVSIDVNISTTQRVIRIHTVNKDGIVQWSFIALRKTKCKGDLNWAIKVMVEWFNQRSMKHVYNRSLNLRLVTRKDPCVDLTLLYFSKIGQYFKLFSAVSFSLF